MDRETLFRAVMAALIAFLLWTLLFPPAGPPAPPLPTTVESAPQPSQPAVAADQARIHGADSEVVLELGDFEDHNGADAYPARIELSNRGAAVRTAELSRFFAAVRGQQHYQLLAPVSTPLAEQLSFATDKINLNLEEYVLSDQLWHQRKEVLPAEQRAVFWLDFGPAGGPPFGRLTKTYFLKKQPPGSGHSDINMELRFENLGTAPCEVIITQWGPVGMRMEDPRSDNRKVSAAVSEAGQLSLTSKLANRLNKQRDPLYKGDTAGELSWVAMGNKFFAVIMAPEAADGQIRWVREFSAIQLLGVAGQEPSATFEMVTRPAAVAPGQTLVRGFDCYLGPKSKKLFTADPAYVARQYVELINDDYYICAWAPIVNVLLFILNGSYALIPNYGFAIIILVLIVRTILHPLTKKGQVNMTKMSGQMAVLQPKMEEIRKKYATDQSKMGQEMMKLYQQEGINPAAQMPLTCLPMMLQMPIWGALWASLNFTVEMRHQPFILWIRDLTAPDALLSFAPVHIPLLSGMIGPVSSVNLLPPLLGIGMWLQQKYMPKPATPPTGGKSQDQMAQQRIMMAFMSVFMVVIFYNAPAGLTLYIMASNFFGLIEQYFIRKHIREEAEAAKRRPPPKLTPPGQRTLRKPRFLARLEKMAEEAKRR